MISGLTIYSSGDKRVTQQVSHSFLVYLLRVIRPFILQRGVRESCCVVLCVWRAKPSYLLLAESLCCLVSQTHCPLQVSLCAVCGASSTTAFLWSRCAVWRARLSPCFLTESLCCQREPDSATFPAESVSCVWSESNTVASSSCCCI